MSGKAPVAPEHSSDQASQLAGGLVWATRRPQGEGAMRILLVEDDAKTAAYIAKGLREAGHTVDQTGSGRDGLFLASSGEFDVIVLDRMLPEMDGIAVLKALRGAQISTPVLILSALAQVDDRVRGLKAGGDDYLTKPFAFSELIARIEALGRRPQNVAGEPKLNVGDLELDLMTRRVSRGGRPIDLRPQELRLLEYLMRHAGRVVTRTMLFEGVWDFHFDPQSNVIEVHISRLRQSRLRWCRGSGVRSA